MATFVVRTETRVFYEFNIEAADLEAAKIAAQAVLDEGSDVLDEQREVDSAGYTLVDVRAEY